METPQGVPLEAAPPPTSDASAEASIPDALAEGVHDYRVGDYVYQVYIDGTIRGSMALFAENKLKSARIRDLAAFSHFVARDTSPAEVEAADQRRAAALGRAPAGTAAEKAALRKTEQTCEAFREAEVALYSHAFGPSQGVERVTASVRGRLEARRASDMAIEP